MVPGEYWGEQGYFRVQSGALALEQAGGSSSPQPYSPKLVVRAVQLEGLDISGRHDRLFEGLSLWPSKRHQTLVLKSCQDGCTWATVKDFTAPERHNQPLGPCRSDLT